MDLGGSHGIFDPSDWIQQGGTYKDVPMCVVNAQLEMTQLPTPLNVLLIHRDTPVLKFVEQDIPKQSNKLTTTPTKAWFSRQSPMLSTPSNILNMVVRRTIPPKAVLLDIERALGQEWFDGSESLVDPRYNKGSDCFPFWILTLWRRLASMTEKQGDWGEAVEFLIKEVSDDMGAVEDILAGVGWDSDVECGGFTFTTHQFRLMISSVDENTFKSLKAGYLQLSHAMELFRKRNNDV